jgi:predicted lactoylglutathione lyase
MIMVGARDIQKLRDFYERGLGWQPWGPVSGSAMYKVGQSILVFLNGDYLARERGDAVTEGSKSSLAVFVESKNQVDELFQRAIAAGGIATSAIRDRDGGLYTGYFADPEGNSWEIVWSPHMPLGSDGGLTYPL